jgi:hypothetical protein
MVHTATTPHQRSQSAAQCTAPLPSELFLYTPPHHVTSALLATWHLGRATTLGQRRVYGGAGEGKRHCFCRKWSVILRSQWRWYSQREFCPSDQFVCKSATLSNLNKDPAHQFASIVTIHLPKTQHNFTFKPSFPSIPLVARHTSDTNHMRIAFVSHFFLSILV